MNLLKQRVVTAAALAGAAVWMAATAAAQVRSSADYSVTSDVLGAGGGGGAAAQYDAQSHVGGAVGLAAGGSPACTLKHGFVGGIYEVTGLSLTASPESLPENGTREVSASAVLDDDTRLVLADSDPDWTVDGWPLVAVSPSGVVTAGTVYASTSGTVRASYDGQSNSLILAVINVGNDDFQTYAGDGLPDGWQVGWFGIDNPSAGPDVDVEGDGHNNLEEYVADTDPTDPSSYLCIMAISNAAGTWVRFPSSAQREYSLLRRVSLDEGNWLPVAGMTNVDGVGGAQWLQDTNAAGSARYYRVRVQIP
jgi:hypothetical protein